MMKAIQIERYGTANVLDINEVLSPELKDKQLLDEVLKFNDIAQAHIKSEFGHVTGKIIVRVDQETTS